MASSRSASRVLSVVELLVTASACVQDSSTSLAANSTASTTVAAQRTKLEALYGDFWIETDPDFSGGEAMFWPRGTTRSAFLRDCGQPSLQLDSAGGGDSTYWSFVDPERLYLETAPEGAEVLLMDLPVFCRGGSVWDLARTGREGCGVPTPNCSEGSGCGNLGGWFDVQLA